ncbi:DNA gyrase subunit A [Rivihabitans pingtungensis]|uniref:DNA gyrase subunit A n=1 Tax=Rivihabitans pingtungensis TaxID=1054498 RepID=A0A318KV61_9NEIS|nr:DNA gyrase subunit A [Rivihabitans pingtungensis]PXX81804.1 DNA gyrase subunit A [Rivihabitans pingtungensis]
MTEHLFAKETLPVSLEEEMRRSYLDYAMSVIVGRALPDVRDGLKPVHRRVLFAMHELSNDWNRAYKKSARIVGDVIGKYHPHGDTAVYDTIVRMAQDFSLRYPLVDGQGNFGSVDGDNAAAMRYTEIRMARIAHELLADIEKETVDFGPNYDGSEHEPLILPAKIPNLLINGSSGIAVGMATNIPPHNLNEVVDACLALLANGEMTIDELIDIIPAPDFPTAGIIYGTAGVKEGYRTGRGRVVMRARTHVEDIGKGDRQALIVDEIPYQVNKARLLERIGELVREKTLEGISEIRDESDKSGMRVVIELKRGEVPDVVLNNLFKMTQLQDSFGINMVALVDGQPRLLNIKQILEEFLRHRREVVTRRTVYELRKARERGHVLEGLAVALSNVDPIITLIKASPTPAEAKRELMGQNWRSELVAGMLAKVDPSQARPDGLLPEYGLHDDAYRLSDVQAQAILELRLQRLTGLEQDKIVDEYRDVMATIIDLSDILARTERVSDIIAAELNQVKAQFGDARRSEISVFGGDINIEDLITPQDMVVTISHGGYIKAQPLDDYRAQRRGGRGKQAAATKDDDFIETLFAANTHDYLLCFSSLGRMYWIKVYDLPQGSRNSRGKPMVNVLPLADGEKINALLPVKAFTDAEADVKDDIEDEEAAVKAKGPFIFMCTASGTVKKTPLQAFSRPRAAGIIAVKLDEGDNLIGVALTSGHDQVMLFSNAGKAVRFDETAVRPMGRTAAGVRGMQLGEDQQVISLLVTSSEDQQVLTASDGGYGKRTRVADFRQTSRGTQGVIAMDLTDKTGLKLVAASLVEETDDIMLITDGGVLIRTKAAEVRETGRAAQGVRLINLDDGERLVSIVKVAESDDADADAELDADAASPTEGGDTSTDTPA